ncbi:MAG TPA: aminoglycoside phosphotransferase family protein [Caldilineaceae bacterium]|nr:aminoglycoside phosphotransferase family protein [Caldilineaceae bacterium]
MEQQRFHSSKKRLLADYGIDPAELLNRGMEAEVYALDDERVLKLYHAATPIANLQTLQHFYATLTRQQLSYALPVIQSIEQQEGLVVVVEKRLHGQPLATLVAAWDPQALDELLARYLHAVVELGQLTMPDDTVRYKLFDAVGISARGAGDWHQFLLRYVELKLTQLTPFFVRDVTNYDAKVQRMGELLAQPYRGPYRLIHGDFFPGNLLVDDKGHPTALLDFGLFTMYGDPLFDLATACAFFDMYDELGANLCARLFDLACAQFGEALRPMLHRYLLLYSFLSANTYSSQCADGHYAWCVANLNNSTYWEAVI